MSRVVDVVNFNADASCLPAAAWLGMLNGGTRSQLCQWLGLYVRRRQKVVLGFVGSAIADMAVFNPEAIKLVNDHPEIFEVLLRPFAHDIALLRSTHGFATNLLLGILTISREFKKVVDYFLPPEFMLTSSQVAQLASRGVKGTFINSARFKGELQGRIPNAPYVLEGVLGARLNCISFCGELTDAYLQSIHFYGGEAWNEALQQKTGGGVNYSWRDGESCFLLPDSIEREAAWLGDEARSIERRHLSEEIAVSNFSGIQEHAKPFSSYPTHSFSAWFKENRMLGFLGHVQRFESRLDEMSIDARTIWLQVINSDILSAVEKDSPTIMLREIGRNEDSGMPFTIWRTERGFEGEDFLVRLERLMEQGDMTFLADADFRPHIMKLKARADYLRQLEKERR